MNSRPCSSCGADCPASSRFCPSCGRPLAGSSPDSVTLVTPSSASHHSGAFLPGEIVASRYRIVSRLGAGGMGEVFRADDLKLGQPVAMKFLPASHERDADRLERLIREVRIARQISHPNVCRVYDIQDVAGRHFLTMELIEGEDLASLLRRIGRLPHEKALDLAREIGAGIAAAHDRGVLHRDLKPANIMIDERGTARITDFGLAGSGDVHGIEAREGTPAYQAPEQLDGTEATRRSDIYAFGLIVHELFTGRRPFRADSLDELRNAQRDPSSVSSTAGADPGVLRMIAACLEHDPARRPASVRQALALLPGGDPLDAAMAAGETPSPEAVAGSLRSGALSVWTATALLAATVVLLAVLLPLHKRDTLITAIPFSLSPEQLSLRAREILEEHGLRGSRSAHGLVYEDGAVDELAQRPERQSTLDEIRAGRRAPILFFRRVSDVAVRDEYSTPGPFQKPPLTSPGDAAVQVDLDGRLRSLRAVAPEAGHGTPAVEWEKVFSRAGLSMASFRTNTPVWTPPVFADRTFAWTEAGHARPLRVVAGTVRGSLVYFEVVPHGAAPVHVAEATTSSGSRALIALLIAFYGGVLAVSVILVRRNLKLGRLDLSGTTRLGSFLVSLGVLTWVVCAPHELALGELGRFFQSLGVTLTFAFLICIEYAALEPVIRRHRPQLLISWLRLLQGDWRDPAVARDILIGTATGLFVGAGSGLQTIAASGDRFSNLNVSWLRGYEGMRGILQVIADSLRASIFVGLSSLVFIVLLLIVTRRYWIATTVFGAGVFTAVILQNPSVGAALVALVSTGVFTVVVSRYGLLTYVVTHFFLFVTFHFPLTADQHDWYFSHSVTSVVAIIAFAGFWCVRSVGAQSFDFGRKLVPE